MIKLMKNDDKQTEFKEIFDLYDIDMTGYLAADDAKEIISSFGFIISEEEMANMVKNKKVAYSDLFKFYNEKMKNPNDDNLLQAFQGLLSKKTGKISAVKFKQYLMSFGLKFTEAEANEVLQSFQLDSQGNIDYDKFIKQMNDQ